MYTFLIIGKFLRDRTINYKLRHILMYKKLFVNQFNQPVKILKFFKVFQPTNERKEHDDKTFKYRYNLHSLSPPALEEYILKFFLLFQVKEKNASILEEARINEHAVKLSVPHERSVWCYPVQVRLFLSFSMITICLD